MNIRVLLLFFIFLWANNIASQQDSIFLNKTNAPNKTWFISLAEITASNILVNRLDLLILKAEWARVNPTTWNLNLQRGLQSDGDNFTTNFFAHPVHGSIYYNSARSLGCSYWESGAYSLGGSLMWEFFGENLPASEVDINTTVQGGMYIGEITNRLSRVLLRNNHKRPKKFLRNTAALLINPMGKVNGWFYDDIKESFTLDNGETPLLRSQFSIGFSIPLIEFDRINVFSSAHFKYDLLYGDIFKQTSGFKPFDSFILTSWVDVAPSLLKKPFYLNIVSHAVLFKKSLGPNSFLSVSQHYDYLDNQAFKIGATSITADYTLRHRFPKWGFVASINFGVIPFGSSSSEVLEMLNLGDDEANPEYVYGRGYLAKIEYIVFHNTLGRITGSYNHWYINTENYVQGVERTSLFQARYFYPVSSDFSIGIELLKYGRIASYKDIPNFENINENYEEIKILFTSQF